MVYELLRSHIDSGIKHKNHRACAEIISNSLRCVTSMRNKTYSAFSPFLSGGFHPAESALGLIIKQCVMCSVPNSSSAQSLNRHEILTVCSSYSIYLSLTVSQKSRHSQLQRKWTRPFCSFLTEVSTLWCFRDSWLCAGDCQWFKSPGNYLPVFVLVCSSPVVPCTTSAHFWEDKSFECTCVIREIPQQFSNQLLESWIQIPLGTFK